MRNVRKRNFTAYLSVTCLSIFLGWSTTAFAMPPPDSDLKAIPKSKDKLKARDNVDNARYSPKNLTRISRLFQREIVMGHKPPEKLVQIPAHHTLTGKRKEFLLYEVLFQFEEMARAAAKDGVELKIISGYRNFSRQRFIWERKWSGAVKTGGLVIAEWEPAQKIKKIIEYSAMPGLSRHHWGTEIDLNSLDNNFFLRTKKGRKTIAWLEKNAIVYGFCRPYDGTPHRPGYQEEKWHWSFKKISEPLTRWALQHIRKKDVQDFSGAAESQNIESILESYVGGINADCL